MKNQYTLHQTYLNNQLLKQIVNSAVRMTGGKDYFLAAEAVKAVERFCQDNDMSFLGETTLKALGQQNYYEDFAKKNNYILKLDENYHRKLFLQQLFNDGIDPTKKPIFKINTIVRHFKELLIQHPRADVINNLGIENYRLLHKLTADPQSRDAIEVTEKVYQDYLSLHQPAAVPISQPQKPKPVSVPLQAVRTPVAEKVENKKPTPVAAPIQKKMGFWKKAALAVGATVGVAAAASISLLGLSKSKSEERAPDNPSIAVITPVVKPSTEAVLQQPTQSKNISTPTSVSTVGPVPTPFALDDAAIYQTYVTPKINYNTDVLTTGKQDAFVKPSMIMAKDAAKEALLKTDMQTSMTAASTQNNAEPKPDSTPDNSNPANDFVPLAVMLGVGIAGGVLARLAVYKKSKAKWETVSATLNIATGLGVMLPVIATMGWYGDRGLAVITTCLTAAATIGFGVDWSARQQEFSARLKELRPQSR